MFFNETAKVKSRLLWEDTSDSSSSDDDSSDEESRRVPRQFRLRNNHFNFEQWTDEVFRMKFRLSKATVSCLEEPIKHEIASRNQR